MAADTLKTAWASFWEWLLLEGDRRVITVLFLLIFATGLVIVVRVSPDPFPTLIQTGTPVTTMFQALTLSLITVVSLVVVFNQLVLSQELGPVVDQREHLAGSLQFRRDIESFVDPGVAPTDPSALMAALSQTIQDHAVSYQQHADRADAEGFQEDVTGTMNDLIAQLDRVRMNLVEAEFGTYAVMSGILEFNYSHMIQRVRALEATHGAAVSDDLAAVHRSLLDGIQLYGLSREHFKTLYFEWALIELSRSMLYLAIPALIVSVGMTLFFGPDASSITVWHIHGTAWIASGAAVVVLSPIMHLFSYILRIATMAKRTLATGPFVLVSEE